MFESRIDVIVSFFHRPPSVRILIFLVWPEGSFSTRCVLSPPVERQSSAFLLTERILNCYPVFLKNSNGQAFTQLEGIRLAVVTQSESSGWDRSNAGWQETPPSVTAGNLGAAASRCESVKAGCLALEGWPSPTCDPSVDWAPRENICSFLTHICHRRAGRVARSPCGFFGQSSRTNHVFPWGLNFLRLSLLFRVECRQNPHFIFLLSSLF